MKVIKLDIDEENIFEGIDSIAGSATNATASIRRNRCSSIGCRTSY